MEKVTMGQFKLERVLRKNVKTLTPYASARDEFKDFDTDMVFLDANESPYENGINRYPDPHQNKLKTSIAKQKGIKEEQILLGNGSDEVLDLIFRVFCEPNQDNIISLPPTYGMYKVLAGVNAVENREVWLNPDFQPDVPAVLQKVDANTKLIFICSPNNPTGNTMNRPLLEEVLNQFPGVVVIDEAYVDFSEAPTWLAVLDRFPNLIVTQTLSKAYGMAGIRLGMCFADKKIIDILKKVKPPYNVNQLTQNQALHGITNQERILTYVQEILSERKKLSLALQELSFVQQCFPSDANFILVRVDDADLRYEQLLDKGIVVRNRSTQPLCENTLRFTVGTPQENEIVVQALAKLE